MFNLYGVVVNCLRAVDYIYGGKDEMWQKGTKQGFVHNNTYHPSFNHHSNFFTLSVASASISVDKMKLLVYKNNHHFYFVNTKHFTATVYVDMIELG